MRNRILDEEKLDRVAETEGWTKLDTVPRPPMASYRRYDGARLNFWLTTGTVGSYLEHPRQGKTQLFRRKVTMSGAYEIFENPRIHTGAGYKRRGGGGGGGGGRGPCRKGIDCQRVDCYFSHPSGWNP